jgi:hypothetical protein
VTHAGERKLNRWRSPAIPSGAQRQYPVALNRNNRWRSRGQILNSSDTREFPAIVAGPAALLVAKLHKLHERINERRAVENKDAHDIYRLLVAIETRTLIVEIRMLEGDPLSAEVTREALGFLLDLFGSAEAPGSVMAGAAEVGVGNPTLVSESVALLANDLASALRVLPS